MKTYQISELSAIDTLYFSLSMKEHPFPRSFPNISLEQKIWIWKPENCITSYHPKSSFFWDLEKQKNSLQRNSGKP